MAINKKSILDRGVKKGALYIFIILLCRIVQHIFNKKSSNNINSISMFVKYGGFIQLHSAMFAMILIIISGVNL